MNDALAVLIEAGAAAWPDLRVSTDAFREHLVVLAAGEDSDTVAPRLAGADLYLAFACLEGSPDAWRALEREHLSKIGDYVRKIDASPAFADEIRHRVSEKLVAGGKDSKLALYSGRGPLWAWIRITALRDAHSI